MLTSTLLELILTQQNKLSMHKVYQTLPLADTQTTSENCNLIGLSRSVRADTKRYRQSSRPFTF